VGRLRLTQPLQSPIGFVPPRVSPEHPQRSAGQADLAGQEAIDGPYTPFEDRVEALRGRFQVSTCVLARTASAAGGEGPGEPAGLTVLYFCADICFIR
jgi:hypothetical protein